MAAVVVVRAAVVFVVVWVGCVYDVVAGGTVRTDLGIMCCLVSVWHTLTTLVDRCLTAYYDVTLWS